MKTPNFAIKIEAAKKPEPGRGDAIQIHTKATSYGMKIFLPESLDNDRLLDLLSRIPAKAFILPDDKGSIAFDFKGRLCTQELLIKLLCNVIWRKRIKVAAWLSSNPETVKLFREAGLEVCEPEIKKPEKVIEKAENNNIDNSDNKNDNKNKVEIIYEPRNLKVLYNSMRSGDSLVTGGDVLLWGHLNAGAEIRAGGNIIVAGKLRGLVHAGQGIKSGGTGGERIFVMAGSFEARQLRIGRKLCYADENTAGWHKSVLITLEDGMPMIRENKFEIF